MTRAVDADPADTPPVVEDADNRSPEPSFQSPSHPAVHAIFLLGSIAVIAASFLMSSEGESKVFLPGTTVPMPGLCGMKTLLGVECPGCGLTRSFINISHGQWARAWTFNPAGFLIYGFLVFQIGWQSSQLIRHLQNSPPLTFPVPWVFVLIITASLLAQWAVKLVIQWFG